MDELERLKVENKKLKDKIKEYGDLEFNLSVLKQQRVDFEKETKDLAVIVDLSYDLEKIIDKLAIMKYKEALKFINNSQAHKSMIQNDLFQIRNLIDDIESEINKGL